MNHFFLMLWLADVLSKIAPLLAFLLFIWVVIVGVLFSCQENVRTSHKPEDKQRAESISRYINMWFKYPLAIIIIMSLVALLSPSVTTIRIMATADLTQTAITTVQQSSTGQKAIQALNVELDKIIKSK